MVREAAEDGLLAFRHGDTPRFAEPGIRRDDRVGLQANERWERLVQRSLHEIGADLADAIAAGDHHDWPAVLAAVRLIQGRAVVTRAGLERVLELHPDGPDLPPLVRAVRAVHALIPERDVLDLPPDELRARMLTALHTLDDELGSFLRLPG